MAKVLDLFISKNSMLMDYLQSQYGFDIFSHNNSSDHTFYAINNGNDNGVNDNNNSPVEGPPTPVNIDNLPEKVKEKDYTSGTERESDTEGVDEFGSDSESSSDDERSPKRARFDDSDDGGSNPEYNKGGHDFTKAKESKNDLRSQIQDSISGLNESVDDMNNSIKPATIVRGNPEASSLRRTHSDMVEGTDSKNAGKKAFFPDRASKEEFKSDLDNAKRHQKNLNDLSEEYNDLR
jgi:hypothetical protein